MAATKQPSKQRKSGKNSSRPTKDESVRISFRLNPERPKERVVLDFLQEHTGNYDASRMIKQALYEMVTGLSWVTGQPLQRQVADEEPMPKIKARDTLLDDIMAGLNEWGSS
jgi:hypothetical protein